MTERRPSSPPLWTEKAKEVYPLLNTSQREIRLLRFTPYESLVHGLQDHNIPNAIFLDSSVYKLGENPSYVALSYTWGNMNLGHTIWINGKQVRVGANLFDACRSLEYQWNRYHRNIPGTPWAHVWVDALCINQEDANERNHQVGFMGDVYRSADEVAVWTGRHSLWKLQEKRGSSYGTTFTNSPYWQRAWIVQEFLLAKSIVFIDQKSHIFLEGVLDMADRDIEYELSTPMRKLLVRRQRMQDAGAAHSFVSFSDLLLDFEGAGCKEAHDVIYSLLCLIDWTRTPELPPLKVDYAVPKEEVAQRIIEMTRCAGLAKDAKKVDDLIGYFERVWGYTYQPGPEEQYQERLAALLEPGHGRDEEGEGATASSS